MEKEEVELSWINEDDLERMLEKLMKLLEDVKLKEKEEIKIEMLLRDIKNDEEKK